MKLERIDSQPLRDKKVILQIELPPRSHSLAGLYIAKITETIELLQERGARTLLTGHSVFSPQTQDESFAGYQNDIAKIIGNDVPFFNAAELKPAIAALKSQSLVFVDNLLHLPSEKQPSKHDVTTLAEGMDLYVTEAFTGLGESYASSTFLPAMLPSFLGMQLAHDLDLLQTLQSGKPSPTTFIMGGQNLAESLPVLRKMLSVTDNIILGGVLANTALKGNALQMGSSVVDRERLSEAFQIVERARLEECHVELPVDHIIVDRISAKAKSKKTSGKEVADGWIAVDVGPKSLSNYEKIIKKSGIVFMHGPLGASDVFEFQQGTVKLLKYIAKQKIPLIIVGEDLSGIAIEADISPTLVLPESGTVFKLFRGQSLAGLQAIMASQAG